MTTKGRKTAPRRASEPPSLALKVLRRIDAIHVQQFRQKAICESLAVVFALLDAAERTQSDVDTNRLWEGLEQAARYLADDIERTSNAVGRMNDMVSAHEGGVR